MKHTSRFATASCMLLFLSAVSAQEVSSRVLEAWESAWDQVVQNALDAFLQRAADGPLATADDAVRRAALADMRVALYPAFSWDSYGDSVVEDIVSECGEELVSEMTPWIVGDVGVSEIDPGVVQAYTVCVQTALGHTIQQFEDELRGKQPELQDIFAKHGVSFRRDSVPELPQLYVSYPLSIDPDCRDGSAKLFDECGDQIELFRTALARANAEDKVLLVEIGAEWCIWCHVFDAHINGDRERFSYTYGTPEEPDARFTRVFNEGGDSNIDSADTLRDYVASHFVVVHIDIQYAPRGYEVMELSNAIDAYYQFIPFVYTVDSTGDFAKHFVQETVERRRDSGDWYRGYDRAGMLEQLTDMYNTAVAER